STPSLNEQIRDDPSELPHLVGFIVSRLYGERAESLSQEVVSWIESHLGLNYPWPGNFCELEQCIRNIVVRNEYHPLAESPASPLDRFTARVRNLDLSADELLNGYCRLVYAQTGSYVAAARQLGLDRRTVRQRVDPGASEGNSGS